MTITIDLSPEVEAQLRECMLRGDDTEFRNVVTRAIVPHVEARLLETPPKLTLEEYEALADELADIVGDVPPLPDYAFTRESFYEGHPKV